MNVNNRCVCSCLSFLYIATTGLASCRQAAWAGWPLWPPGPLRLAAKAAQAAHQRHPNTWPLAWPPASLPLGPGIESSRAAGRPGHLGCWLGQVPL